MSSMNPSRSGIDATTSDELEKGTQLTSLVLPEATKFLQMFLTVWGILLGWISVSIEVFLRHDFGERYLSWVRLSFAGSLMLVYLIVPSLFGGGFLFLLFWLAFVFFSYYHRFVIWTKKVSETEWHSQSFGISHLQPVLERLPALQQPFRKLANTQRTRIRLPLLRLVTTQEFLIGLSKWRLSDWTLYKVIEPLLCLLISLFLFRISFALGFWIALASIALSIKAQITYSQVRNRYLDLKDSRIEGEVMQEAASGRSKSGKKGFSLIDLPALKPRIDTQIPDIKAAVDDIMQGRSVSSTSPSQPITTTIQSQTPTQAETQVALVDFSNTLADIMGVRETAQSSTPQVSQQASQSLNVTKKHLVRRLDNITNTRNPSQVTAVRAQALPDTRRYWLLGGAILVPWLVLLFVLVSSAITNQPAVATVPSVQPTEVEHPPIATFTPILSIQLPIFPTFAPTTSPTQTPLPTLASVATPPSFEFDDYLVIDTEKGRIICELYSDPLEGIGNTLANFQEKAEQGYFNGLVFFQVGENLIAGGDPNGDGTGGSTMMYEPNTSSRTLDAGVLVVSRSPVDPILNSDSIFFIPKVDMYEYNGQYTILGQVVEGMDVVNQIVKGDRMYVFTTPDLP